MFAKRFFLIVLCIALFVGCGPGAPTQVPASSTESPAQMIVTLQPSQYMSIYPSEYRAIKLPDTIVQGLSQEKFTMIELPQDKQAVALELQNASNNIPNLSLYNFDKVATFSQENSYIAVPAKAQEKYDFSQGVLAGLLYDQNGAYRKLNVNQDVYEVWLYEDKATMQTGTGEVVMTWELGKDLFYEKLDEPVLEPVVVFVKNGCWGCWSLDHRSGCLYCK